MSDHQKDENDNDASNEKIPVVDAEIVEENSSGPGLKENVSEGKDGAKLTRRRKIALAALLVGAFLLIAVVSTALWKPWQQSNSSREEIVVAGVNAQEPSDIEASVPLDSEKESKNETETGINSAAGEPQVVSPLKDEPNGAIEISDYDNLDAVTLESPVSDDSETVTATQTEDLSSLANAESDEATIDNSLAAASSFSEPHEVVDVVASISTTSVEDGAEKETLAVEPTEQPQTELPPAGDAFDVTQLEATLAELADQNRELTAALEVERDNVIALISEIQQMRASMDEVIDQRSAMLEMQIQELREVIERERSVDVIETRNFVRALGAVMAIKEAAENEDAFQDVFEANAEAIPSSLEKDQIEEISKTGALTAVKLRESFPRAARKAIVAASQQESGGLISALKSKSSNLIVTWPSTPRQGDAPPAIISRAEAALDRNDISEALVELAQLPDASRQAMVDWMEYAKRRAILDTTITDLERKYAEGISQQ